MDHLGYFFFSQKKNCFKKLKQYAHFCHTSAEILDTVLVITFGTNNSQSCRPSGNNNIAGTNFTVSNAHFDNYCLFSDAGGHNI